MQLIRNPVVQFLAVGIVALVVVVLGTGELSRRAADQEAVDDSRRTTEVLARSVAQPAIPRGLVAGRAGAIDRFDRAVLDRLLVDDVQRIKIWNRHGRIVYSDKTALIGETFELGADERAVLSDGSTDAEVSDLSRPENRFEAGTGGLLEVYTRVRSPEGDPLLFEAYYSADRVAARKQAILDSFRPITLGGLLLLLVLTTPLLVVLTRRLQKAAREREHLLRAAVEASGSERRRIARDLHDGVVQDLVGTSYELSATGQALRADQGRIAADLDRMSRSLRTSLRSLRSLLVEIYPPDLSRNGLASALADLVAPAAGANVDVDVDVADLGDVDDDAVALVWRVAQEAVRNALRHGHPDTLLVRVCDERGALVLEVRDDGRGFEPGNVDPTAHFGLRGLRDLIREAGGRLDVQSAPGAGTTVRLEVENP